MAGKVCKVCHTEKALAYFPSYAGHPEWLMGMCKDCKRQKDNEYSRNRNARSGDKVRARNRKWAEEHREKKGKWNRENVEYFLEYARQRRKVDVDFRLRGVLRCRMRLALRGLTKSARTMEMVGCSTDELKRHLEAQFRDGMTWGNYGGRNGWQIDHIVPCASFDMSRPEEQRRCFNYTNLQPLWAEENMRKGDRVKVAA